MNKLIISSRFSSGNKMMKTIDVCRAYGAPNQSKPSYVNVKNGC